MDQHDERSAAAEVDVVLRSAGEVGVTRAPSATKAFASGLALTARDQSAVHRRVERQTRQLWHAVNLPSATDVRRVYEQLSVLDRRLQGVKRRLDEPTVPRVADRQ